MIYFLTDKNMQIKIKYDPSISSFKTTYLESRTDTLGSQYPIIRRNGNVKYRQFPISGLITAFCDEEGVFINKKNIYGDSVIEYDKYNELNNINEYNDFIYERKFRERIMDFLHDNSVKLFRSTTEGNILVKLMDISFTPNQTLGRMLYSFSATAYEVDDYSLENLDKHGIQLIGKFSEFLKYTFSNLGQLKGLYGGHDGQDIKNILQEKYAQKSTDKYINTVEYIKWLRIEFNSPPYLIKTSPSGAMYSIPVSEKPDADVALGYIVQIDGKQLMVSPNGFYELIDDDTVIKSIIFPVEVDVTIDYEVVMNQIEDTTGIFNKMNFYTKVGQMADVFKSFENIFLRIYEKYYISDSTFGQKLLALNKVTIEAEPGAVVWVRDSFDETHFKHEIGQTGILELYDDKTSINGLYIEGVHLHEMSPDYDVEEVIDVENGTKLLKKKDGAIYLKDGCLAFNAEYFNVKNNMIVSQERETNEIRDNEFRIISNNAPSLYNIKHPIKNGVYTVDGNRYIFYHGHWSEFSNENVVQCPVEAIIDYIYEMMKGEY